MAGGRQIVQGVPKKTQNKDLKLRLNIWSVFFGTPCRYLGSSYSCSVGHSMCLKQSTRLPKYSRGERGSDPIFIIRSVAAESNE